MQLLAVVSESPESTAPTWGNANLADQFSIEAFNISRHLLYYVAQQTYA